MSDGMSERIVRAVWEAWCGGEKPPVTAVRQGPGKYLVRLPLGILTVGAASADEYRGAAAVLSQALGIPVRITHARYVDRRGAVTGPSPYADGVNVGLQLRPDPQAGPPGPAPAEKNGDQKDMTTPNGTVPPRMRLPDEVKDGAPAEWKALADAVGEAEPATDEEYLDLLAGQIAGMGIYGEAIADLYETCVDSIRLDPVAMASLHDVADAAGDFVTAVAYARQKFAGHYQEVREFTGEGGVLPKDGDWITGEGDA